MATEQEIEESVYQPSDEEPGVYVYRPEIAAELRRSDQQFWNVEAAELLNKLYEKLGVPTDLRR